MDTTQNQIIEKFEIFKNNREELLEYLIELGDELPSLNIKHKIEKNKVSGCLSEVWIFSKLINDKIFLYCDSNTKITKGLLSLLVKIFSGLTINKILNKQLYFIKDIGLESFLGSQRMSGLSNMILKIKKDSIEYLKAITEKRKKIVKALQNVFDPEIPVDICALGLIYNIDLKKGNANILITLTSPNCPAAETIPVDIKDNVEKVKGVKKVFVEITFDPPYDTEMMSEEAKLELGFV